MFPNLVTAVCMFACACMCVRIYFHLTISTFQHDTQEARIKTRHLHPFMLNPVLQRPEQASSKLGFHPISSHPSKLPITAPTIPPSCQTCQTSVKGCDSRLLIRKLSDRLTLQPRQHAGDRLRQATFEFHLKSRATSQRDWPRYFSNTKAEVMLRGIGSRVQVSQPLGLPESQKLKAKRCVN